MVWDRGGLCIVFPCDYLQHWRSYAADRGSRWLAGGALVSTRCQGLVGRLTCEHGQYIRSLQTACRWYICMTEFCQLLELKNDGDRYDRRRWTERSLHACASNDTSPTPPSSSMLSGSIADYSLLSIANFRKRREKGWGSWVTREERRGEKRYPFHPSIPGVHCSQTSGKKIPES